MKPKRLCKARYLASDGAVLSDEARKLAGPPLQQLRVLACLHR
jgi:hypothetical protein